MLDIRSPGSVAVVLAAAAACEAAPSESEDTEDGGSSTSGPDVTGSESGDSALPGFEVRYRTRYVDVAPGFSAPVCRGTLDELDRHVEEVASMLAITLDKRLTFYWFSEHAAGAVDASVCDFCDSTCNGCFAAGRAIVGHFAPVFHEIVHAVIVPTWGRADVVFEEGIAYGLQREHVALGSEDPSELAGGSQHGGAHFSRWLLDRFGPESFRQLFELLTVSSTKEEVFAAVEDVYGVPFLELEQEYFATAPTIYHAPGLCDGLVHVPWQGDEWVLATTVECDAPHVFGPRDEDAAMVVSVTLDIPDVPDQAYRAEILPDGPPGLLIPCIDEPLYDVDPDEALSMFPIANWIGGVPRPGSYRLVLPVAAPGDIYVRIYDP